MSGLDSVKTQYDLVIIGGGTGGYAAAFRARELGRSVALIEREKLGGTCLHRGCVPTKSLLHAAELVETIRLAPRFGIRVHGEEVVWSDVQRAKREVVQKIYTGLRDLAKARAVDVIHGDGRLSEQDIVGVESDGDEAEIEFDSAVLATGSRPRTVTGLPVGGPIMTSDQALELDVVPESIIVVGGGYVGVEFASMWRSFGSDVTIVEAAPRLMLHEDQDISLALTRALEGRGIKIYVNTELRQSDIGSESIEAELFSDGGPTTIRADKMLVAVGRAPAIKAFADSGIEIDGGFVAVDGALRSSRKNVYAVGDLLPTPQLAHVAFAEGIFAAEVIAGLDPEPIDYGVIPHCVYSYPEVASVGMTEDEARSAGLEIDVVRSRFSGNSRANIAGAVAGEAKVVTEVGGGILGVQMIGPSVTELVAEATLITGWAAEPEDVAKFLHPHPTFSEVLGEAALKLAGKPLHTL